MRRATGPGTLLVAVLALLVLATAPAAAHVNHAEADAQRSANGTLVVEWVFSDLDGWLVVRADDDGEPGDAIGHRRLPSESGFRTDRTVAIDDESWAAQTGSRTVWVALHREEGGQGFDPAEDPAVTFFGNVAGSRIVVEKADRPARVTTQEFGPQPASDGTVTIRRAELPAEGFVAVHASRADVPTKATDEDLGAVVGTVALDGGVHRNVTVELEGSFVDANDGTRVVQAVLYRGTGSFDADETAPITAGDSSVSTGFALDFAADAATSGTAEEESFINTPEDTTIGAETATPTVADGTAVGALGTALLLLVTTTAVARRQRD